MEDIKNSAKVKNNDMYEDFGRNEGEYGYGPLLSTWKKVFSYMPKSDREKLVSGYDLKKFAKIFEDPDTMRTLAAFLNNGMNVSAVAKELYMHRNTLSYKLNSVKKQTGLDLRDFNMAVTFVTLYTVYILK